jgi:hypothetical protein
VGLVGVLFAQRLDYGCDDVDPDVLTGQSNFAHPGKITAADVENTASAKLL